MNSKFSIFLKTGGGQKAASLNSLVQAVSRVFDELSEKEYITPAIQLHIEFRVDGDVYSFEDPEGCSSLKFLKKKNVIANTVAIKEKTLKDSEKSRQLSLVYIKMAIEQILDRLIKEKYSLKKEEILSELNAKLDLIK